MRTRIPADDMACWALKQAAKASTLSHLQYILDIWVAWSERFHGLKPLLTPSLPTIECTGFVEKLPINFVKTSYTISVLTLTAVWDGNVVEAAVVLFRASSRCRAVQPMREDGRRGARTAVGDDRFDGFEMDQVASIGDTEVHDDHKAFSRSFCFCV